MYQGVREQVRNICLSSIHTRLLITYCPAFTPRWIAGRRIRDVLRPRCYFIIGTVHRREDVHQKLNNVILNVVFRYTRIPLRNVRDNDENYTALRSRLLRSRAFPKSNSSTNNSLDLQSS